MQVGESTVSERKASLPAPDAGLLRHLHAAADMTHSQGLAVPTHRLPTWWEELAAQEKCLPHKLQPGRAETGGCWWAQTPQQTMSSGLQVHVPEVPRSALPTLHPWCRSASTACSGRALTCNKALIWRVGQWLIVVPQHCAGCLRHSLRLGRLHRQSSLQGMCEPARSG